MYFVERMCGICFFFYNYIYMRVVEEVGGIEVFERVEYICVIIGEFERIYFYFFNFGVFVYDIGYDILFYFIWLVREKVMDIFEVVLGNCVNYLMVMIGGVRRDIDEKKRRIIEEMIKYYREVFL